MEAKLGDYRIKKVRVVSDAYGYAVQKFVEPRNKNSGSNELFWHNLAFEPFGTKKEAEEFLKKIKVNEPTGIKLNI